MRALFILPLLLAAHPALASDPKPEGRKVTVIPASWSLQKHESRAAAKPRVEEIRLHLVAPAESRPFWYDLGEGWHGGFVTKFHSDRPHSGVGLGLRLKF